MRYVVLAVGRVRPPFSDDVQHYRKMLAGYCRVEQIEVREDQDVQRRIPDRSYVVLLDREGRELDSVAFARWIDAHPDRLKMPRSEFERLLAAHKKPK